MRMVDCTVPGRMMWSGCAGGRGVTGRETRAGAAVVLLGARWHSTKRIRSSSTGPLRMIWAVARL